MKARPFLVLLVTACGAPSTEEPPKGLYANDTHTGGSFGPREARDTRTAPSIGVAHSALSVEGEVILLLGDAATVTRAGGGFGIQAANQEAIIREVIRAHGDVFDTIQIYLSFPDDIAGGSAYYSPIANTVAGLGINSFNSRPGYGLPEVGRLSGFSNMNVVDLFVPLSRTSEIEGRYHAVVAQELSHRWLFHLLFRDAAGMDSRELLGRMDAHYSPLVQSFGSVQDGVLWLDNEDGTFTHLGQELGFAPLDLYAMGVYRKEQVGPFFVLVEANLSGTPIDKDTPIPAGARITARRVDITVDQIIASMGPRNPPVGTETPYYRAAFVLVTAPGQPEASFRPYLEATQRLQESFPETWKRWTFGASALCTKVSERCPEPALSLHGFTVDDGDDDVVAPGDQFALAIALRNEGLGTTNNVAVNLVSLTPGVQVLTATISLRAIAGGEDQLLDPPFTVQVEESVPCRDLARFEVWMTSEEGPRFVERLELVVGQRTLRLDPLNEGPDWRVDPDGDDAASGGRWALEEPELISILGVVTQPASDHSPGEAELAFMTGPERGASLFDSDVDGGQTTLESPLFALQDSLDPELVFYAWRVALDFSTPGGPSPVPGSELLVLGSENGGESYHELLRIADNTDRWTRYSVRLREHLVPSNRMRFRFQVADDTASGTVEVGIDDLEVVDLVEACIEEVPEPRPDGGPDPTPPGDEGCGCAHLPRKSTVKGIEALLLVLVCRWFFPGAKRR